MRLPKAFQIRFCCGRNAPTATAPAELEKYLILKVYNVLELKIEINMSKVFKTAAAASAGLCQNDMTVMSGGLGDYEGTIIVIGDELDLMHRGFFQLFEA